MWRMAGVMAAFAWTLFAQTPPAVMAVDVAAADSHGLAVTDLRAEEISVEEDKLSRAVLFWRANERANMPHATAVVFNLAEANLDGPAWKEAIATMRRFEHSEYLYFYVLTKGGALMPVHPLPDPAAGDPLSNAPWMDDVLPRFASAAKLIQAARGGMQDWAEFSALAGPLGMFPGRKSLVCIGCLAVAGNIRAAQGPPAAPSSLDPLIADAVRTFVRERVAVYAVSGVAPARGPTVASDAGGGSIQKLPDPRRFDGFAVTTGGRAYVYGEVGEAVSRAISGAHASYRLAYETRDIRDARACSANYHHAQRRPPAGLRVEDPGAECR